MFRDRITHRTVGLGVLVAVAVLAPLQHVATAGDDGPGPTLARAPRVLVDSRTSAPAPPAAPVLGTGPSSGQLATAASPAPSGDPVLVTEPDVAPAATPPITARAVARRPSAFAERHADQLAAVQDPADPATTRWALLIGINEHLGSVADNIGSRQDAEALRAHLLANGWRDDHILLLTDRAATGAAIRDGLRWLADKTDESSVAVFHYSGHSKKWRGDRDGDGEWIDEGLWPTDDDFIIDSELVALLDPVQPAAFWISFASCNAAGFADPGLVQPRRVLTFSSGEPQKSYEHPSWGHSVWGWFLIEQGMRAGVADLDGNGRVSVEEAWTWGRPHAIDTTRTQRYGSQDAVIVDQLEGELHLGIPGVPPPARPDRPAPEPTPEPAPAPQQPPSEPDREPDRHGGYLCVLCGGR